MKKKISTHFSDSTHQECMIFARIGHGPCYHHWNEIFAGVSLLSFDFRKNCAPFVVTFSPEMRVIFVHIKSQQTKKAKNQGKLTKIK